MEVQKLFSPGKVVFETNDGKLFPVQLEVAFEMKWLTRFLNKVDTQSNVISLQFIDAQTFSEVLNYCEFRQHQKIHGVIESQVVEWMNEFLKMDRKCVMGVLVAANFLDVPGLVKVMYDFVEERLKEDRAGERDGDTSGAGKSS